MDKKKPETASQMLESLNEFLIGPEPDFKTMPADKVAAYLEKNRIDANSLAKTTRSMLSEARGQIKLAKAREKRLRIEQDLPSPTPSSGFRVSILEQIRALAGPQTAAVYARRFGDAPDADLRSLVEDFELLDQLDLGEDEQ